MATFAWHTRRIVASQLVADDALSNEQIAAKVGVSRQTLDLWIANPTFQERVVAIREAYRVKIEAEGIANRQNRIAAQNDRWDRMRRVIEARAQANPRDNDAPPGAESGLHVRQEKQIGAGRNAIRVVEWKVDTGLLAELRAHEQQAAKELGQWTDRTDLTSGGRPIDLASLILSAREGRFLGSDPENESRESDH